MLTKPLAVFCLLLVCLFWAPPALASNSSASTITSPDINCNSGPGSGALYIESESNGVSVANPTGATLTFHTSDFAGGGLVLVWQGGRFVEYGGGSHSIPVHAFQMQTAQGTIGLSAGTTLPGPDFTVDNSGGGGATHVRVSSTGGLAAGLDWTGGIGTPTFSGPNGGGANGTLFSLTNASGSGATINILDSTNLGAVRVEDTSIALGFLETITFVWDDFTGWVQWSRGPSAYFNGGSKGGGRVITTTDATPTQIMRWLKGNTDWPGIAFEGDIAATVSGGGAGTGYWQGVRCAWDDSNTQTLPLAVDERTGNNSGDVPTGWALTCSDDATYHNLLVTGAAATTIKWRANNFHELSPPF